MRQYEGCRQYRRGRYKTAYCNSIYGVSKQRVWLKPS